MSPAPLPTAKDIFESLLKSKTAVSHLKMPGRMPIDEYGLEQWFTFWGGCVNIAQRIAEGEAVIDAWGGNK